MPTTVNIKNKEARLLPRTPILLQCNTLPWARQFAQEREAFVNRNFHHIDLKKSKVLHQINKKANPLYFGRISKELECSDRILPTWTYSKTDPKWDLLQDHARKLNDKAVVHWLIGDGFREWLVANMTSEDLQIHQHRISTQYDRINELRADILDLLDPFYKEPTFWSSDYNGRL